MFLLAESSADGLVVVAEMLRDLLHRVAVGLVGGGMWVIGCREDLGQGRSERLPVGAGYLGDRPRSGCSVGDELFASVIEATGWGRRLRVTAFFDEHP